MTERKHTYLDQELNENQEVIDPEFSNRNLSDQELEREFTELVITERKITHQVLLYIQEIDHRSLHLSLGYSSLAEYLIKKHHYSEGSAFRRISAMRMLKAVPEIKEKILDGKLNLSQLAMTQSAIVKKQKAEGVKVSNEDKRELLLKIESQSMAKTQSCLADNLNIDLNEKKQITHGKDESVYLNFKFTKEEFQHIKDCLDVMSHQAKDYKDLFVVLVEKTLKAKGKIIKEEVTEENRVRIKEQNKLSKEEAKVSQEDELTKSHNVENKTRTRFISAALKKEIFKRDQWRCQYKGSGNHICGSQKFLQIHHLKAFAKGGANTKENLSLRCQAHNLYEAEQEGLLES